MSKKETPRTNEETIIQAKTPRMTAKQKRELERENETLAQIAAARTRHKIHMRKKTIYWSLFGLAMAVLFGFDILVTAGLLEHHDIAQYSVLNLLFRGSTFEYYNAAGELVVIYQNTFLHNILRATYTTFFIWLILKVVALVFAILKKNAPKRRKTILAMTGSFIRYVGILIGVIAVVAVFGVNLGGLLAGAGVLAIVVGFGLQSIIADIFAGVFIVLEDNFDVGDIVTINGFRGEVINIGIRTTAIKAFAGEDIMVVNNNDLRSVINMTKYQSMAIVNVTVSHTESLERIEKILANNLPKIEEALPAISGLAYKGPSEFGPFGVTLLFIAGAAEADRPSSVRAINREIKVLFDKYDIKFSAAQVHEPQTTKQAAKPQTTKIPASAK